MYFSINSSSTKCPLLEEERSITVVQVMGFSLSALLRNLVRGVNIYAILFNLTKKGPSF